MVDSEDIPLNLSRELLQESALIRYDLIEEPIERVTAVIGKENGLKLSQMLPFISIRSRLHCHCVGQDSYVCILFHSN